MNVLALRFGAKSLALILVVFWLAKALGLSLFQAAIVMISGVLPALMIGVLRKSAARWPIYLPMTVGMIIVWLIGCYLYSLIGGDLNPPAWLGSLGWREGLLLIISFFGGWQMAEEISAFMVGEITTEALTLAPERNINDAFLFAVSVSVGILLLSLTLGGQSLGFGEAATDCLFGMIFGVAVWFLTRAEIKSGERQLRWVYLLAIFAPVNFLIVWLWMTVSGTSRLPNSVGDIILIAVVVTVTVWSLDRFVSWPRSK